jgi:hypothetical protein
LWFQHFHFVNPEGREGTQGTTSHGNSSTP